MYTWSDDPGNMNLILIFLCLQAISRVTIVFSSIPIYNSSFFEGDDYCDNFEDEDGWGLKPSSKSEAEEATSSTDFDSPTSILHGPVSPVPFKEGVEEDFTITKEWIEFYLLPTFLAGRMISSKLIQKIIKEAKFNFASDDTIQDVHAPYQGHIVIVGDIHGQFESTLSIFEDFGFPSRETVYIFNGDIVDRGDKSLECILMVFAYKIALSGQFYVTRGNHESSTVGKWSFYEECLVRLSDYPEAFDNFHDAFEALPYGYVVEGKYFVTHGGLGPDMDIDELKELFRTEFSYRNNDCLRSMLWNDPCEDDEPVDDSFLAHSNRGPISKRFHPYLTKFFLEKHNLRLLIRSHQMAPKGYLSSQFGMCLTIFSAPNYVNRGNRGAVVIVTEDRISVQPMYY